MKNIAKFLSLTIIATATICSVMAKDVQVKGYTKKDGTVVKGYTRHVKDASDASSKEPAKADTAVKTETKTETKADAKSGDKTTTEKIKSYTKKDGTVVKGYSRKDPAAKK
jgi:hypothetical protein